MAERQLDGVDAILVEARKTKETAERMANGDGPSGEADDIRVLAGMVHQVAEEVERLAGIVSGDTVPLANSEDSETLTPVIEDRLRPPKLRMVSTMNAADDPTDHVLANRVSWDADADSWVERGRLAWTADDITWGIWYVPESVLRLLPDVHGLDVIELGCGTGYVSSWLSRRGARPVGLDNSGRQLATARMFQDEFGIRFPLIHADAERAPLRDGSFDLAVSEYGAALWCDPYRWIPEAARILRLGGRLVFLSRSYLSMLTSPEEDLPASERLQRDHFGLHRFDWPDAEGAVEFGLSHGDMLRVLRDSGFEVEDLVEVQAPEGAETPADPLATAEWARRWPIEEAWKARRTR